MVWRGRSYGTRGVSDRLIRSSHGQEMDFSSENGAIVRGDDGAVGSNTTATVNATSKVTVRAVPAVPPPQKKSAGDEVSAPLLAGGDGRSRGCGGWSDASPHALLFSLALFWTAQAMIFPWLPGMIVPTNRAPSVRICLCPSHVLCTQI